jgi:hypothetical protein
VTGVVQYASLPLRVLEDAQTTGTALFRSYPFDIDCIIDSMDSTRRPMQRALQKW